MKKFTKRLMAFLLTSAMAISTATIVPQTASAATPKSTTKNVTLKVSSVKISGFKKIESTIKVGKYVVAYGTNSKNKNIYAYSTDGKKFSKAKSLGLSGKVSYQTVGNYLYVLNTSNPLNASYKCISNPEKLGSSKTKKIKITLPSGYKQSSSDLSNWGFSDTKKNTLYLTASFYGSLKDDTYMPYAYSVALTPSSTKVTNMLSKAKSLLKNDNVKLQGSYISRAYDTSTYHAGITATNENNQKHYFIYTTDGSNFKATPALPEASDTESFDVDWINGKPITYRSYSFSDSGITNTLNSDSQKHGIYYLLNTKTNKWEKKTTGKYTATSGFSCGYFGDVSVTYSDTTTDKDFLTLTDITKNSVKSIISSNGTSWTALPKLNYSLTNKKLSRVEYTKTASTTYAEEIYYMDSSYQKQKIVISKLSKGTWKKLKTLDITTDKGHYYSTEFYATIPGILYNNGKTTTGYNLKTGKSYQLPFNFTYNQMLGGDSMVFHSGSKLYLTKDGYKTFKNISLKSGNKKLTSKITKTSVHSISKKTVNAYIICGAKMYYTTTKQLISVK